MWVARESTRVHGVTVAHTPPLLRKPVATWQVERVTTDGNPIGAQRLVHVITHERMLLGNLSKPLSVYPWH